MGVTVYASGTQTAEIGTEHFLSDVSAAGIYEFNIDAVNMASGDVLEMRVYKTVLTGGTPRVPYLMTYYGAQPTDDMIKISPWIMNDLSDAQSLRFSLKQTFGTGRDFDWKVLQLDIPTSPSAATVAAAVLDEAIGSHEGFLTTLATEATLSNLASIVALEATLTVIKGAGWTDETLEKIDADVLAGGGTNPWDEILADHTTPGTTGEKLGVIPLKVIRV